MYRFPKFRARILALTEPVLAGMDEQKVPAGVLS
jgi:hypothetical protein